MAKKKKSSLDLSFNNLLMCALYAVIGLLLVILRGGSLGILMTVVGVVVIALGVIDVFKNKNLLKGVIEAIVGVVIIVCGWTIASWVLLIFGIVLIIKGILELIPSLKNGLLGLLAPIGMIVVGILLVVAKWALMDILCLIAGILFLVNAVLTLFGKSLKK